MNHLLCALFVVGVGVCWSVLSYGAASAHLSVSVSGVCGSGCGFW